MSIPYNAGRGSFQKLDTILTLTWKTDPKTRLHLNTTLTSPVF